MVHSADSTSKSGESIQDSSRSTVSSSSKSVTSTNSGRRTVEQASFVDDESYRKFLHMQDSIDELRSDIDRQSSSIEELLDKVNSYRSDDIQH